ncbi:hypothetical protein JOM56_010315 [Amanita muscaria]
MASYCPLFAASFRRSISWMASPGLLILHGLFERSSFALPNSGTVGNLIHQENGIFRSDRSRSELLHSDRSRSELILFDHSCSELAHSYLSHCESICSDHSCSQASAEGLLRPPAQSSFTLTHCSCRTNQRYIIKCYLSPVEFTSHDQPTESKLESR